MADWELLKGAEVTDLGVCGNTREEAEEFVKLVKERDWDTVYLVTSANHMKRAEAVFLSAGVSVVPVGCDYMGYPFVALGLIPSQVEWSDCELGFTRRWVGLLPVEGWIRLEACRKNERTEYQCRLATAEKVSRKLGCFSSASCGRKAHQPADGARHQAGAG